MPAGAGPAYPVPGRAWRVVAILFLAGIVSVLDRGILNIVVDPVRADLALTDVQISLLQGLAFGIFYATVGVPLGLTADRWSRRNLVIVGVAVWSLATAAGGLAASFGSLFSARLLVGLGEAALSPCAISLIADLFPPHQRGRPISLFLTGQAIANGLSISITSFITASAAAGHFAGVPLLGSLAPWRVAFVCCGASGFLVVAALLTTREPARRDARPTTELGRHVAASLRHLVANGAIFLPLYLGFALCFLASYGAAAWAPTMLMRGFGATRVQIGTWLGPLSIAFSVIGPGIGGFLVDHYVRAGRPSARFRILSIAPLCAIPSALATFAPELHVAILLVASSSAVFAVIGTAVLASLQAMVPPQMRGLAVSLSGLPNTVISATGGPLLISVFTEHVWHDPARVGLSIVCVVVPALLLGSALFGMAAIAARRQVNGGGATAALAP